MPGSLIVSYSRSGGCQQLADWASSWLSCPHERITALKPYSGILGFVRGGYGALSGSEPPIAPLAHNSADFDEVILIFPIWAGSFPPPIASYLTQKAAAIKCARVVTLSGSGEGAKALDKLSGQYGLRITNGLHLRASHLANDAQATLRAFILGS